MLRIIATLITDLVFQYCSAECQKQHWPLHKVSCKSPMLRSSWKPSWYTERRQPSWITKDDSGALMGITTYGPTKYLWGNMPAFDLLNCKENEQEVPNRMSFLFAGRLPHGDEND